MSCTVSYLMNFSLCVRSCRWSSSHLPCPVPCTIHYVPCLVTGGHVMYSVLSHMIFFMCPVLSLVIISFTVPFPMYFSSLYPVLSLVIMSCTMSCPMYFSSCVLFCHVPYPISCTFHYVPCIVIDYHVMCCFWCHVLFLICNSHWLSCHLMCPVPCTFHY